MSKHEFICVCVGGSWLSFEFFLVGLWWVHTQTDMFMCMLSKSLLAFIVWRLTVQH